MNFTKDQTSAFQAVGENVIVSAGAGSGKTQVLAERVRYLVQEKNYKIQEFLILTFTELAAMEMKSRVRKKLSDINSTQVQYIDNASICTFDSYALSFVKKYHNLLSLDKDITILDENIITILIKKEIDEIFLSLYEKEDEAFVALVNRFCFKSDKCLKDIVYQIYKKAVDSIDEDEYITNLISKGNNKLLIDEFLIRYENRIDEYIDELTQEINSIEDDNSRKKSLKILSLYSETNNLDEKVLFIKEKLKIRLNYNDEEQKQLINNIKECLKKHVEKFISSEVLYKEYEENKTFLKTIIKIVMQLIQKDKNYKLAYQAFCFNDIAKMAIKIVKENPIVCAQLKKQYKTIMIDEYQDTSKVQETFITYIANNNVYQVGDVKQSIYRFRKATPEIFIEKFNKYKNHDGGRMISLSDNFRSRPEVLDDINYIFSHIMSEDLGGANYAVDHIIGKGNKTYSTIGKVEQDNHLEVIYYEDAINKADMEAKIIAEDIIKKVNSGYLVLADNKLRKVKLSDFCILMDRGVEFERFKSCFAKYKIPTFIENNVNITNNQLTLALCNMLRIVRFLDEANYAQNKKFIHAFMSLARSFVYALNDEELFYIVKNNLFEQSIIIKEIKALIKTNSHHTTYHLILDFIDLKNIYGNLVKLGDIRTYEKYLDDLIDNLSSLQQFNFSIEDFIDYFDNVSKLDLKVNVPSSTTSFDAVKIMNIFKSKGLEFPIIYCAGLYKGFNDMEYRNNMFLISDHYGVIFPDYRFGKTILAEDYHHKEQRDDLSEKIRLFYVELTRAKEKIICLLPKDIKEKELQSVTSLGGLLLPIVKNFTSIDYQEEDVSFNQTINHIDNKLLTYEDISIENKLVHENKKASKSISFKANNQILLRGEKLHFYLESIDFMHPDLSIIEDKYDQTLINKFLNLSLIKNLKNPKIYKEYEFIDEKENTHGIIDCLIIDENKAIILDYKLKNIDDEAYVNQIRVYFNYVKNYFNMTSECYLYSILSSEMKKITF